LPDTKTLNPPPAPSRPRQLEASPIRFYIFQELNDHFLSNLRCPPFFFFVSLVCVVGLLSCWGGVWFCCFLFFFFFFLVGVCLFLFFFFCFFFFCFCVVGWEGVFLFVWLGGFFLGGFFFVGVLSLGWGCVFLARHCDRSPLFFLVNLDDPSHPFPVFFGRVGRRQRLRRVAINPFRLTRDHHNFSLPRLLPSPPPVRGKREAYPAE